MLTKDQILNSQDHVTEKVPVPEWGGEVFVRTITGAERDKWESTLSDAKGKLSLENVRARLLALCICDDKGNPIFNPVDAVTLGRKSARALDRVFAVARKLNGIGKEELEDLAKNSDLAQSGDSCSA